MGATSGKAEEIEVLKLRYLTRATHVICRRSILGVLQLSLVGIRSESPACSIVNPSLAFLIHSILRLHRGDSLPNIVMQTLRAWSR